MQLLPRDIKFYDQFLGQSSLILEAARLLNAPATTAGPRLGEVWNRLREIEVAANIVWAWALTIPAAGVVSWLIFAIIHSVNAAA